MKCNGDWIRKMEIDTLNCHLYCCANLDLYIYDFNGHMLKSFKNIHRLAITCCVYSPNTKLIITGSADTQIKIWSLNGALMDTFRGHSKPITKLLLLPHNSNIILSASLDGCVKVWSLDIMQQIYQ